MIHEIPIVGTTDVVTLCINESGLAVFHHKTCFAEKTREWNSFLQDKKIRDVSIYSCVVLLLTEQHEVFELMIMPLHIQDTFVNCLRSIKLNNLHIAKVYSLGFGNFARTHDNKIYMWTLLEVDNKPYISPAVHLRTFDSSQIENITLNDDYINFCWSKENCVKLNREQLNNLFRMEYKKN